MVKAFYGARLICDFSFIDWLVKQPQRDVTICHLTQIKASSEQHRRTHNLILNSEAKKCVDNEIITAHTLSMGFKSRDYPFPSDGDNDTARQIFFAIYLADSSPYKCNIFTSPEKVDVYLNNRHFKGIPNINVYGGSNAMKIIDTYYDCFKSAREASH